ncbi:elongation factor P maturation arginine rhamnosyltransferase EarP [Caenimonas aquaedulcis]|uniref:Protein-arginine rhamnosyltransferase n=1 Tax=Caenimonas aquaedulcis TaxID=2793270 RepID=A0A931MFJ5_9BURK|nr:elongation factor P maturation arginine rhamnosyltransferase EarP [Caenimonas aquaedulcis]MBG9387333.1 elongation factor P maturation arginine rhamnosyltransferase EarP [Caenimonas aquaedulcis]
MLWDIFCKVIDNHGDIGVCWRLARGLASRGERVRLWIDDASALRWMAPEGAAGVEVREWPLAAPGVAPGEVVVEAFGCELPAQFQAAMASQARERGTQAAWINLEYLTAESFAARCHGLPSPVLSGPAAGLTKHFFYPGFTQGTGGLLREPDLLARQAAFDRAGWLRARGIEAANARLASLFCYEPPALDALLAGLSAGTQPWHLLVTHGRAGTAVRERLSLVGGSLAVTFLPLMTQAEFDRLLWACDFNFVRGEDSLVRALWAGKPFAWQIYPQDDDAHHAKLEAFLEWMAAPDSLRQFHRGWNGIGAALPPLDADTWSPCALLARDRLLAQKDLVTQLMSFQAAQSSPA